MLLWVMAKSCIPLFVVQQSRCDSIVSWCALGMASQCICPMHNLRQTASKPSIPDVVVPAGGLTLSVVFIWRSASFIATKGTCGEVNVLQV